MSDLETRIDRLESRAAIEQLAIRYALAVDGRNLDAWTALFVPDVACGQHGVGREVLRRLIDPVLRTFYRSVHQICGHRIMFEERDAATGIVYCRAEHEDGDRWIVMAIAYFDEYRREAGEWYFVRRREKHWYAADWEERPRAPFTGWDTHPRPPQLPGDFASWSDFWKMEKSSSINDVTVQPVGDKDAQ